MSADFTPGPWRWVDRPDHGDAKVTYATDMGAFVGSDGERVMWFGDNTTYYPVEGEPPEEADRHLIAAAPELYEALEEARLFILSEYQCAEAAALEGHHLAKEARPAWERINAALSKARGDA